MRRLLTLVLATAAVLAAVASGLPRGDSPERLQGRVTAVVDGDTLHVRADGERHTVRLIGIDTPESKRPGTPVECGALAAAAHMLRLAFTRPRDTDGDGLVDAEGGRGLRVTLRTDPTQDTHDRYGRLLAYVTPERGRTLQERMLRAGWATTYVFERPFRAVGSFRAAERGARRADRGVWGRCGGDFHRAP
jgi:micrococcal nuclease